MYITPLSSIVEEELWIENEKAFNEKGGYTILIVVIFPRC